MKDLAQAMPACGECSAGPRTEWAGLPAPCRATVERVKRPRMVEPGAAVFRQGAPSAGIHCLSDGLVGLRMQHENGEEAMVALATPGALLGARAFLRNSEHRTTAIALTPAQVCTIPRSAAVRLTQEAPSVHLSLVKRCLAAMDEAQEERLAMAALSNRARLCRLLHRFALAGQPDAAGPAEIRLPVSRVDLAQMIGMQPESLSRLLGRLRREGVVAASGRHLSVPDLSALAAAGAPSTSHMTGI